MAKLKKQLKKPVKKVIAKKKPVKKKAIKKTNPISKRVDSLGRSLVTKDKKRAKNKMKILEKLKGTFGIATNAIAGICDNTTFYQWIKDDNDFKKAIEDIQDQFDIIVDDKIKQGVIDNDGAMIRFYASCRMKKYRTKIGLGQDEDLEPFEFFITTRKTKDKKNEED